MRSIVTTRARVPFAPRRVLLGMAIVMMVVGGVSALAGAKTTVKVQGDDVTITVPIDCAGCKGKKGPDGSDLAKYWEKTAEDAWNAAFAKYPYCSKYLLHLKVDIASKNADFAGREGRDLLQVANASGDRLSGVGWDGQYEQNPSGQPGQRSPDGTRFFDGDAGGFLTEDASPTVITHEIGHALGLGDDRDATGNVLPGRAGTIMVGGANGVTPRTPLTIDKALVDRIGKQLEHLGKIDKCKATTYAGTVRGHEVYANQGQSCVMDGTGTVSLEVDAHHKLSGTLQTSETTVCTVSPFGSVSLPDTTSWSLSGRGDDKELKVTAVKGAQGYFDALLPTGRVSISIRGGKASVTLQGAELVAPGARSDVQGTLSFDLTCTNCKDAVA